jgi:tellurite resistance protein
MEFFLGLALIFFGGWVIRAIFSALGAAGRTAIGKGSLSENLELSFKGMPPLEARTLDAHLGDDPNLGHLKKIEVKGLFPVQGNNRSVAFVVSVFDNTDAELAPVISVLDQYQEPDNAIFQDVTEIPPISEGQGYMSWVQISAVLPDLLQPPYGGKRQMLIIVRLMDRGSLPDITHGFADEGILWQTNINFTHVFTEKGYMEASEHREEAQALSVKVAIAVAMADGSFDDSEGEVITKWIRRAIEPFGSEKREELKSTYNNAMREAYADAKDGSLSLSVLTERLNEIGEAKIKYDAVELCFEVMAADGEADPEEMRTIRKIGEALDLDLAELEAMRDQKIVGLESHISSDGNIEELLGIEADWSGDKVKAHLRSEFQKWNNRLNALSEGQERENAQAMIDMISRAREKYGSNAQ